MAKEPTQEEALALVYEYRDKDPKVVALAKAYSQIMTRREIAVEHWNKLDHEIACLKRSFKP